MKILIMTDLECVSGITTAAYMESGGPGLNVARRNLTLDINAAVEGCFKANASAVDVKLGHGPDTTLLDMLDPRVQIVADRPGVNALNDTHDATMMLGQHAKAGTLNAFLEHTQCSRTVFEHRINGVELGEIGQWALMAGHFDIPVVFLAGDDAACREAEALLPGIRTASVGTASGRESMTPRHQRDVHSDITKRVEEAIRGLGKSTPAPYKLNPPYTVRIVFKHVQEADRLSRYRIDRRRLDGRTLEMTVESPLDILALFL